MSPIFKFGIIMFLFSLPACGEQEETKLLHESVLVSNERAIVSLDDATDIELSIFRESLEDESKIKYLPIGYALDSIYGMLDEVELYISFF